MCCYGACGAIECFPLLPKVTEKMTEYDHGDREQILETMTKRFCI